MSYFFRKGDKVVLNDLNIEHRRLMEYSPWYSNMNGVVMTIKAISGHNIRVGESGALWISKWLKPYEEESQEDYLEKELFEI